LLAFITVNYSKVFIWVNYEINKAEITEKYCVNKDKPSMHCCGKCLLKKKLAEEDEKQKSPAMPDIKNDIQLFSSSYSVTLNWNKNLFSVIGSPYNNIYLSGVHSSVFHPPQA
jgi:hypothetical protein